MNVIGTGLSGLVGSRVTDLLNGDFSFVNLSLETGVDITDYRLLEDRISHTPAEWIFHFAAFTNVDNAQKDKPNGQNGQVWKINVTATENLAKLAADHGKKLLYISTDFVFNGQQDGYSENDTPNPINWYGVTKYQGEKAVQSNAGHYLIIRISYPFRTRWTGKPDLVANFINLFRAGTSIDAPRDQIIVPTYIDDIASAIGFLTKGNQQGIFHVTGSEAISPYDMASKIAVKYSFPSSLIRPTTLTDFYGSRAPRPLRSVLRNDKITGYGIKMKSFSECLPLL